MRLSVLTFNTFGTPFLAPDIARRYSKAAEIIQQDDIDILCFQEVFAHYNKFQFNRKLTKYPYRVYKSFLPGLYGGLAVYAKLPIEYQEFITYTFPQESIVPPYTKLAHNGMLVTHLKDIPLTIATTHLTSDIVHNVTPENKFYTLIKKQLEEAAQILNRLTTEQRTVLLVGDFNIAKDSVLYKEFVTTTGAQDLFSKFTTPTYTNDRIPYFWPAKTNSRIDFMFLKEGKTKLQIHKIDHMFEEKVKLHNGKNSYLSDHIGLKAVFDIK